MHVVWYGAPRCRATSFLGAFQGSLAPGCPLPCAASVPSWHTIIVDGHSVEELCKAFGQAKHQPTAIIAKTFKGRGITGLYVSFPSPTATTLELEKCLLLAAP